MDPTSRGRRKTIDFLALDVRDGKVLDKSLAREILSSGNQLETILTIQPPQNRVIATVSGGSMIYQFNEPASD
jgi:hypothetical protein